MTIDQSSQAGSLGTPSRDGAAMPDKAQRTVPYIDTVHDNIAFANSYRIELLKLSMTIAAGLLAFTVSFRPKLVPVEWPWAMWIGWAGLVVSIVGGMVHMEGWDHFYKSYRDIDWRMRHDFPPDELKKRATSKRDQINLWRRFGMSLQYIGLAIGVTGVGLFASVNIDNVQDKDSAKSSKVVASGAGSVCVSARNVSQAVPLPVLGGSVASGVRQ